MHTMAVDVKNYRQHQTPRWDAIKMSASKINHLAFNSPERTNVADGVGAYSPASALSILLPGLFIPECVQVDTNARSL